MVKRVGGCMGVKMGCWQEESNKERLSGRVLVQGLVEVLQECGTAGGISKDGSEHVKKMDTLLGL